jgi:hypothetical protein
MRIQSSKALVQKESFYEIKESIFHYGIVLW